jgi:hypothetical protein
LTTAHPAQNKKLEGKPLALHDSGKQNAPPENKRTGHVEQFVPSGGERDKWCREINKQVF